MFNICTLEQIYSIFVFGQVVGNEYIKYLYSVSCLDMNIFDLRIFYECIFIRNQSRIMYSCYTVSKFQIPHSRVLLNYLPIISSTKKFFQNDFCDYTVSTFFKQMIIPLLGHLFHNHAFVL